MKPVLIVPVVMLVCLACWPVLGQDGRPADLEKLVGQPADVAPGAYQYRADRSPTENPPESWIGLMKCANLPFDKAVDVNAPAWKKVLCGLIWEEVRRVRRVTLTWNGTARRPRPEEVVVAYFDAEAKGTIPTWWNTAAVREAGRPEVSADGRNYTFAIPQDTFGLVVGVRGQRDASAYEVPQVRAFVPDRWKRMDLEVEWGFDKATAALDYSGRVEAYDGIAGHVRPLAEDAGTTMKGPDRWQSAPVLGGRRGVSLSLLYLGESKDRKHWPYNAEPEDVARTIVTVWTSAGNFSFLGSDLEQGPILAPEYGFFVRAAATPQAAKGPAVPAKQTLDEKVSLVVGANGGDHICDTTIVDFQIAEIAGKGRIWNLTKDVVDSVQAENPHADASGIAGVWHFYTSTAPSDPYFRLKSKVRTAKEFVSELAARRLETTRMRVRGHPEQTWDGAVGAMFPNRTVPPIPKPDFLTPMKVEVPCEKLSAQWNLGAWHLARHAVKNDKGQLRFNDHPYGILASETYLVLRALDLMGMHKEAADGLDQWLGLPLQNQKPVGLFSDGKGCLTQAVGPPGAGGNMDGVHGMGPGAIMFALVEHFRLTGDDHWLRANAPRMKANVEWILRQRRLLAGVVPGGDRLWCKGLQPAHQVTPDSGGQLMQFYESEAYYWLAVRRFADILAPMDPVEGTRLAAEAEAYRKDLSAAVERSIALSPVVVVRDGTYRSFVPFACYVRGFASGAWSWRRPGSGAHVGGLYWDTIQSAEPLVSPAAILPPDDRRVQGSLDVLEDRLLLENPKLEQRTPDYDPEEHWFAHAGWQYQPGLERHANIHLAADDPPNFLRSWLNQYAVLILPNEGYTFREHTTGGPPDKIFEEAAFLERFRDMLVMEEGDCLWLAWATPRAWLKQGKKIAVRNAPTHFGTVSYQIVSSADEGKITATVEMPSRGGQKAVLLRFRHPGAAPIKRVTVNDRPWSEFDKSREVIRLEGVGGTVAVEAVY